MAAGNTLHACSMYDIFPTIILYIYCDGHIQQEMYCRWIMLYMGGFTCIGRTAIPLDVGNLNVKSHPQQLPKTNL